MNRPARSPLAMRVQPQAIDPPLPVVPARLSRACEATSATRAITFDKGYA